jgi:2-hydroxychromene-2-carboxylate isomerase
MKVELHVYHHLVQEERAPAWADLILAELAAINAKVERVIKKEDRLMTKVSDIQDKANAALAAINAETEIDQAVLALVNHQNDQITALKQQLADAIAAGVDPAAVQALSDTIDAIQAAQTSNAAVVAAAVTAGTPVAVPQPQPDA